MARNYATRASDGRRAVNKRGLPSTLYLSAGATALALVADNRDTVRLLSKPAKALELIPGVLTVFGSESPLLGGFLVEFMGKVQRMTRALINRLLELNHALKVEMAQYKRVEKPAPPVLLLLPAWVAAAKPVPTQEANTLAAAA